jgi:hypothetical protein
MCRLHKDTSQLSMTVRAARQRHDRCPLPRTLAHILFGSISGKSTPLHAANEADCSNEEGGFWRHNPDFLSNISMIILLSPGKA